MLKSIRYLGIAAALCIGLSRSAAYAIVISSDESDSAYLNLGNSPAYSSVGMIEGTTSTSGFVASGTLIDPSWVLTAAHVVDNAKSLEFTVGGVTYTADRMIANPNWNGNVMSGYDIGLVHLSKPVQNVTPAALYTGSGEASQLDTTVGYGKTGNGLTGATNLDGQKRGAENYITQVENGRLLISDFENPKPLDGTSLGLLPVSPLEGMIAPGDSGGGVFINTPKGTFLAGVNSFVASPSGVPDSGYGDFSGQTRVSAFASWIDSFLNGAGSPSGINPGGPRLDPSPDTLPVAAISAVPEPSTFALLGLAGVLLFASRRLMRSDAQQA